MTDVFIVGGVKSLVFGNLKRNLESHGFHIIGHYNGSSLTTVPVGSQGILIIKDMCSHMLHSQAKEQAATAGLPCASVQRKWASAWPVIEKVFDAANALPDRSNEFQRTWVSTSDGPPHAPAVAVLQPEMPVTESREPMPAAEVISYAKIVFEEDPELVFVPGQATQKLRRALSNEVLPEEDVLHRLVLTARNELKTAWADKKTSTEKRKHVSAIKRHWLSLFVESQLRAGEGVPRNDIIQDRCRRVFGTVLNTSSLKEVRNKVVQDIAVDLAQDSPELEKTTASAHIEFLWMPQNPGLYRRMTAVWNACKEVETHIKMPEDVQAFFHGETPLPLDESGYHILESVSSKDGAVAMIPEAATHVRIV